MRWCSRCRGSASSRASPRAIRSTTCSISGVRHLTGGPALPPNPPRRRDAFKVGNGCGSSVVGTLLATGETTVALALGGLLVAACATVTATNLCLPSETFAWLERRSAPNNPTTT